MAFFAEFGFRSYLQNIVESKVNTFFASIIVGLMYSIWTKYERNPNSAKKAMKI
jgi:membrane protease YdiL (CAAX protease family)